MNRINRLEQSKDSNNAEMKKLEKTKADLDQEIIEIN